MLSTRLVPLDWEGLPGWHDDRHEGALEALQRTALHVRENGPHKTGRLGIEGEAFLRVLEESIGTRGDEARAFFERRFVPHRLEGERLGCGGDPG